MTNPETSSDLVKRLEWVAGNRHKYKSFDGVMHEAKAVGGRYAVWHYMERAGQQFLWHGPNLWFDTLEAAQAACQSDYAARILSAIDATTIERLTAERPGDPQNSDVLGSFGPGGYLVQDAGTRYDTVSSKPVTIPSPGINWQARALAAESLAARQAEALKEIARQRTSDTMREDEEADADWMGGFDACVARARAALATESSNG